MQNKEFGRKRDVSNRGSRGRHNFENRISKSERRPNIYYSDNWVLKVSGFPEETTEDELRELLFSLNEYTTLIRIIIRRNVNNHRPPTFALVEFEDFEEAVHAFSIIDGISFKESKISAQFDRSSICTSEAFYRNQGDRQNGSEPRRFEGDNNNNNNNSDNDNKLNKGAERPIFNKNFRGKYPATSFRDGESEKRPTCSMMQHQSPSNSSNREEAASSGCKYTFSRRSHYSVHQQEGAFSLDNVVEEDKVNYLQLFEEKVVVKSDPSNWRYKFDESINKDKPTNFGDQHCSMSLDPNEDNGQQIFEKTEFLDDTRIPEYTTVEESGNSQHELHIDQSFLNIKEPNPGCGPNSSRSCQRCGDNHGPHCPARGKICESCGKLNHFAKMCFSKIHQHSNFNSPNHQDAWKSDWGHNSYGRNHHFYTKRAQEGESSSKDDIMERSSKVDISGFNQEFEKKLFVKDHLLNQGDKFDESMKLSGGNLTNAEGRVCDESLFSYKDVEQQMFEETEVLDDSRIPECTTVEESGNSQHQLHIDQSFLNIKEPNPGCGPKSSRSCQRCGDNHGPHCPAQGDKFDESMKLSENNLTNAGGRVCDESLFSYKDVEQQMFEETEVLDETRTLEVKHVTVEGIGNSVHQLNTDQSPKSSKETNPGFDAISSGPCSKCGSRHSYRCCPAWGKTCQKCGRINHFTKNCFFKQSKPHQPGQRGNAFGYSWSRNTKYSNGGSRQINKHSFADNNGVHVEISAGQ